jgi:hypothetical protein
MPGAELDELIEAVVALQPSVPLAQPVAASAASHRLAGKPEPAVLSELAMPRAANAPDDLALPPEQRAQLLTLRTTILLAAEQQQQRTILLCGVEPGAEATSPAAHLSRLLAQYERLRVAYLEVVADDPRAMNGRQRLPLGYSFQIRRTKTPNLYEIASSLGTVRLDDWLTWWGPSVVLQEMKKLFDVILIQAPAITTHAEVALLAGAVDGVILVATEHETAYASIAAAQQRLEAAQAKVLGVLLNQAAQRPSVFSALSTRLREWMEARTKTQ